MRYDHAQQGRPRWRNHRAAWGVVPANASRVKKPVAVKLYGRLLALRSARNQSYTGKTPRRLHGVPAIFVTPGQGGRLRIREAMRDDQDPGMGLGRVIKVDGQFDAIIPVAGHQDPGFARGIAQLGFVIEASPLDVVHADDIQAQATTDLRHRGVHIFIE